jgi:hypothetical protein
LAQDRRQVTAVIADSLRAQAVDVAVATCPAATVAALIPAG